MALASYKVSYTNNSGSPVEIFFTDRPFLSASRQADEFLSRNKGKGYTMRLYWKDITGPYNFGWKWQRTEAL